MSAPFDPKLAVQTGVLAALDAAPLTDIGPVFQHVPDEQDAPYTAIGEIRLTPAGGKAGGLYEAGVEVITVMSPQGAAGVGREFLTPMMAAVLAQLEDRVVEASGAAFSRPVFESDDDQTLPDGQTYVGVQRFSLFVDGGGPLWLTDEAGNVLTDEAGSMLTEEAA